MNKTNDQKGKIEFCGLTINEPENQKSQSSAKDKAIKMPRTMFYCSQTKLHSTCKRENEVKWKPRLEICYRCKIQ